MYAPLEAVIHESNRKETRRLFVTEGTDREELGHIIGRIMDVYSLVAGNEYCESDRKWYPVQLADELRLNRSFERRFGMPKLSGPAADNGKLWGRLIRLQVLGEELESVGFYVDTNDCDAMTPRPELSSRLVSEFDLAVSTLADTEFAHLSVPVPNVVTRFSYNPELPW